MEGAGQRVEGEGYSCGVGFGVGFGVGVSHALLRVLMVLSFPHHASYSESVLTALTLTPRLPHPYPTPTPRPYRASCSESVFSTFKASCAASFAFCHSFILRCAFEISTKVGPMNAKWAASTAVAARHVSMASACWPCAGRKVRACE